MIGLVGFSDFNSKTIYFSSLLAYKEGYKKLKET